MNTAGHTPPRKAGNTTTTSNSGGKTLAYTPPSSTSSAPKGSMMGVLVMRMPELRFTITKRLKLHDAKSVSAFFANLKAALGPEGFKKVFPLMLTENGLASRPMGSWRPGRRPASYSPRYSSAIRTARTRRRRSRRPTASLGSGSPRAKGSSPEFHLVRDVPFAPSWPHSLPGQKQGPIGSQMKRLRKKRFIFFGNSSFSQNFHLVWELAKRKINFEKA